MHIQKLQQNEDTIDPASRAGKENFSCRTAKIWNRAADRYAAKPIANLEAYERKLAITRGYLTPESNVIELGCGTGSTAIAHSPHVKHIQAFDISSRMIEIAQRKAAAADINNVEFTCSNVNDVPLADKNVDAVLVLNLMHLLVDWYRLVNDTYQALKPGGVLISSTVCMSDSFAFLRIPTSIGQKAGLLPQLSFFTRREFESAIVNVGFQVSYAWQPAPKTAVFIVARKPS